MGLGECETESEEGEMDRERRRLSPAPGAAGPRLVPGRWRPRPRRPTLAVAAPGRSRSRGPGVEAYEGKETLVLHFQPLVEQQLGNCSHREMNVSCLGSLPVATAEIRRYYVLMVLEQDAVSPTARLRASRMFRYNGYIDERNLSGAIRLLCFTSCSKIVVFVQKGDKTHRIMS